MINKCIIVYGYDRFLYEIELVIKLIGLRIR